MASLALDHVTKTFRDDGRIVAVDDLSLEIADGEFLVLVGPSGCGKSTTLRMVAGLESVTEGEILLDGEVINDRRPQDRDVAMVFQDYALYPHMTVRGNMRFGLEESTDMSSSEIDQRVEDAVAVMDITELLDRKPAELSGGQQQRVALGRAIVRDPAVFLMDEPLANLDAKLRAQMRTELQRLQEELDVTTMYVTHDQTEAMTMGDRIAILNDGQLQQVGTPLECYHEPTNLFVAGFIGEPSMNFFETTVEGDDLAAEEFTYPLSADVREAVGEATRVVLGVRPEDVELVGTGREGTERRAEADRDQIDRPDRDHVDRHEYEAVVDVVEPMGDRQNVYLTFTPDAEDPETFVVSVGGVQSVRAGSRVVVRIPEDAVHLFDADDGTALRNRVPTEVEAAELRSEPE